MQNVNSLTPLELDKTIRAMGFPAPKVWKRVDVGDIECYVGDDAYAVAIVEKLPDSVNDMNENQTKTEHVVVKYLQGEGFLGEQYAYVGMQRFNLQKPPPDFL